MRRVQVPFAKKLDRADWEKGKNQSGFSLFPTGLTPVGLIILGRVALRADTPCQAGNIRVRPTSLGGQTFGLSGGHGRLPLGYLRPGKLGLRFARVLCSEKRARRPFPLIWQTSKSKGTLVLGSPRLGIFAAVARGKARRWPLGPRSAWSARRGWVPSDGTGSCCAP
jgi:hypothetical protein